MRRYVTPAEASSARGETGAEQLLAPLRRYPRRAAVMCDIDGTIAPIVAQPEDAVVPARARELLADLSRRYSLVGCLSGRQASVARSMVGIGSLAYIGNHGFEYIRAGAEDVETPPAVLAHADAVRSFSEEAYTEALADIGIRLEDKRSIFSFHWRESPDEDSARAALARVAEEADRRGLAPHWGRKVLEIRPPVEIDKGTALAAILSEAGVETALYAGDDVTDLDAFRSLRRLVRENVLEHVVCVGVRSEEGPDEIIAGADLVADGPEGFLKVLTVLAT
jgi:trehalose 6-phosphate phosphatase